MTARNQHGDPAGAFLDDVRATLGGYAPDSIEPGRLTRFSTNGKRGDTSGWCLLFDDLRGGVFGCYRQGISATWSATDRRTMTLQERADQARQIAAATEVRKAEQRTAWATNAERNARTWAQCRPLQADDVVSRYLHHRGIAAWPLPACLRLHPALPYWHDGVLLGTFPAMVAPITGTDGRVLALHRTYLTADGRKAAVPSPKKLSGVAGSLAGACIALGTAARGCIGVAEGIETALAVWCASGVPTVAAYCAGNLAAWQWPAGVRQLVIFADADLAGREAADTLRARALAAWLRCDVLTPTTAGADWCDVWAERGTVAGECAA